MHADKILIFPNKILRTKAVEISSISQKHIDILAKMHEIMHDANGIGLAATQIGLLHRLLVISIPETENSLPLQLSMINPIITTKSEQMLESSEGCLSLPGLTIEIPRHEVISVSYLDQEKQKQSLESVSGLLSCCLQHEIDHLDGKMIVDYLSPLKRARTIYSWKRSLKNMELDK